jgi:ABC-type sugar transport system substrate-binding protein
MMRSLTIAVAVALAFLCGPAAEASPQGKKIALLITSPTHPFIATLVKSFIERSNALGMEVSSFAQQFDVALQAQQVDDAIARKFDMVALIAGSEQGIVPSLMRAKQAGLPVLMVNSQPKDGTDDLFVSYVGEDNAKLGRLAGESVLKALKESGRDGGKVALITGSLQEGVGPRRVAGFREAIQSNPKVEIVAVEDAKWQTDLSERIAGQLYARFASRGGLDVVFGMADNQAVAALQAAKAANIPLGLEKGKLIVVGSNCLKQGIAAIKAGEQYSTGIQVPTRTGSRSAELIADYFNGKTLPKYEYLPVETVTAANIDKWEAACTY